MSNPKRTSRVQTNRTMSGLQRQIRDLRLETATGITIRPAASDPPPITNNGRWIPRKVYIAPGAVTPTLDIGTISTALKASNNIGATGDFYILKISLWGTYGVNTDNVVSGNVSVNALTVSGNAMAADQIFARDIGTGSRRPGFSVHIPRTDALLQQFNTAVEGNVVMNSVSNPAECHVTVLQLI